MGGWKVKKRDQEENLANKELSGEIPSKLNEGLLRDQREASRIRLAILEGYQDAIEGRTVEYQGDLRRLLKRNVQ